MLFAPSYFSLEDLDQAQAQLEQARAQPPAQDHADSIGHFDEL
jgi:hypothetical protein